MVDVYARAFGSLAYISFFVLVNHSKYSVHGVCIFNCFMLVVCKHSIDGGSPLELRLILKGNGDMFSCSKGEGYLELI